MKQVLCGVSKDDPVIHVYLGLLLTRNLISLSKIGFCEAWPCEKSFKGQQSEDLICNTLLFQISVFKVWGMELFFKKKKSQSAN